jgi:hypothetical protein
MKFRDSHAAMKDKLIFVLYGPGWSLDLVLKVPKDEEDIVLNLTCTGSVNPEDEDHALVWIQSCADVVIKKLGSEDPEDIYDLFKQALQACLDNQGA